MNTECASELGVWNYLPLEFGISILVLPSLTTYIFGLQKIDRNALNKMRTK